MQQAGIIISRPLLLFSLTAS